MEGGLHNLTVVAIEHCNRHGLATRFLSSVFCSAPLPHRLVRTEQELRILLGAYRHVLTAEILLACLKSLFCCPSCPGLPGKVV